MRPADYSSTDDEYDFSDEGFGGYKYKNNQVPIKPVAIIRSALDLKKQRLLDHLKNNDLIAMKAELDQTPAIGFDIDDMVDHKWNLLYHACHLGLHGIVKYLIEDRGACINMFENGETPLMVACNSSADSEDVLQVVKTLILDSTIISVGDAYGVTPLMYASGKGHVGVVKHLLSLNDAVNVIDNERKNALFYAVESKNLEIARMLIGANIDWHVINIFGDTAKDIAINENLTEIADLFPPEVVQYQPPCNFMSYNRFEDLLISTGKSEIPPYFPDVITLLRGMDCERFIPEFAKAEVSLEEFLTISDERLKEIGIKYPYERNIIKLGLFNFHKIAWSNKSLFIPPNFKEEISSVDFVLMLANVLRQVVVIKSQIVFMQQLGTKYDLRNAYNYFTLDFINDFKGKVKELEKRMKKIFALNPPTRPLLIKKKKKKSFVERMRQLKSQGPNRTYIVTAAIAFPILAFGAFKLIKK